MHAIHAIGGPWAGGGRDFWMQARRMLMSPPGRGGPPFRGRHGRGRGRFPFGDFPGSGGFPRRGRAGRGDVRAVALTLLDEQPLHGYQIMQEIAERTEGAWQPSPGSVYPALQQLEDEGLVRAEPTEGKRVFHLTDAGRAYVEEHRTELAAVWDTATGEQESPGWGLRHVLGQVAAATMQVAHAGSSAQVDEARRVLTDTRKRLYRILAEDDPEAADDGPAAEGEA
jgi:DNA-binding PadR family transcriptional regulator